MSPPELPRDETLQSRIALVHQRTAPIVAEGPRLFEYHLAILVEDVALSVVGGRRSWRLVPELGAPLDRQGLRLFFVTCSVTEEIVCLRLPEEQELLNRDT